MEEEQDSKIIVKYMEYYYWCIFVVMLHTIDIIVGSSMYHVSSNTGGCTPYSVSVYLSQSSKKSRFAHGSGSSLSAILHRYYTLGNSDLGDSR